MADADFAEGCPDTRRSVSGWVIMKAGCAISWSSQRQATVALSSMESELTCLRHAVAEVLALRKECALWDPDVCEVPAAVHEDNQSCIHVANGSERYEGRKHVSVRTMFVVQAVEMGIISMSWISTSLQTADLMTKALPGPATALHRSVMINDGVHEMRAERCARARAFEERHAREASGQSEGDAIAILSDEAFLDDL